MMQIVNYSLVVGIGFVIGCGGEIGGTDGTIDARLAATPVVSPASGALTGRNIGVVLRSDLPDQLVRLFQAPPPAGSARWNLIASTTSAGHVAHFTIPASQARDGDDLYIVVPGAGGASTATLLRLWTWTTPGIRTDRVGVNDLGNVLGFTGVLPFFEGVVAVELHTTARRDENGDPQLLARQAVHMTRPGQVGNGLAMVDTSVAIDLYVDGQVNPLLPKNGEILSVGFGTERPSYVQVACFEFCNDLRGNGSCTLRGVACPNP
jgi:hypothetical protein